MVDARLEDARLIIEFSDLTNPIEAAKYLGVHKTTVYRWIKRGKLHSVNIAGYECLLKTEVKALKAEEKQNESN